MSIGPVIPLVTDQNVYYQLFGTAQSAFVTRSSAPLLHGRQAKFCFDLVKPDGMEAKAWADAVVQNMAMELPLPVFEGDFQSWAAQVANEPQLQYLQLPHEAPNWLEWADRMNSAIASNQ